MDYKYTLIRGNPLKKEKPNLVSIVVPALNEQITIGEFVDWCKEGLTKAGVDGEILIIDSSTDNTAEIAEQHGARVIKVPKRGLGQAYIDALPFIKGEYVIMGDCDLTYDFREIKPFIEKLDQGYEFVIGTRLKGYIEKGAMPPLHRYFGTPLTTFILNCMYGSHYSDIHCGIRAITTNALIRMNLESSSWEYASEMVLKAAKLKLNTVEVPTKFYKDREGRFSVHKRIGWLSPWLAGWINLRAMFLYSPDFFLMIPGLVFALFGIILACIGLIGNVHLGQIELSLHSLLLGLILVILGYSALQMGILSKVVYDFNPRDTLKYKNIFSYNRGILAGCLIMLVGLLIEVYFVDTYVQNTFRLFEISKWAIIGLTLLLLGFQTFTFTLVFNMIVFRNKTLRKNSLDG
jgi:glycosyltransferase involved in cell wall biosynthesis